VARYTYSRNASTPTEVISPNQEPTSSEAGLLQRGWITYSHNNGPSRTMRSQTIRDSDHKPIDYRCEDRDKVDELRGEIGASR
jgi:hypothetical protein